MVSTAQADFCGSDFVDQALRKWKEIRRNAGPYPPEAYEFVQEGLRHTVETIKQDDRSAPHDHRHVSGRELCCGLRDFAKNQYGLLSHDVLEHWKIRATEDLGHIVFAMVDAGMLRTSDEDSMTDFASVYSFDEAFERLDLDTQLDPV